MSTVKRSRPNRLYGTAVKSEPVVLEYTQAKALRNEKRVKGRPMRGENRLAPLTLYDLRQLAQLLGRVVRHLPAALKLDAQKQEAKVCGAIAFVESKPPQVRKTRDKIAYLVRRPGAEPVTIYGMDELGKALKRSPNYIQVQLSRGGGEAEFPCIHPETGNPDRTYVTRIGTDHAHTQEPCQEPKIGTSDENADRGSKG